jgi:hypothetical protein
MTEWFTALGPLGQAFVATLGFLGGFAVMIALDNSPR